MSVSNIINQAPFQVCTVPEKQLICRKFIVFMVKCFYLQMTPEEEEKRRLRRERNKLAAFRCRQRRKQHIVELEQVKIGCLI